MYLLRIKENGKIVNEIERKTEKAIKEVWDELIRNNPEGTLDIQLWKKVSYGEQLTLRDGGTWDF